MHLVGPPILIYYDARSTKHQTIDYYNSKTRLISGTFYKRFVFDEV
jgi:hypothetical protein